MSEPTLQRFLLEYYEYESAKLKAMSSAILLGNLASICLVNGETIVVSNESIAQGILERTMPIGKSQLGALKFQRPSTRNMPLLFFMIVFRFAVIMMRL